MPLPNLNNNTNVYVLGAGFSSDAGLPLIRGFLNRMRDAATWLELEQRDDEVRAIQSVLEYRLEAARAAYRAPIDVENIEELFSLAAIGKPELEISIRIAIAATLDFCLATSQRRYIGHILPSDDSPPVPKNWTSTTEANFTEGTYTGDLYESLIALMIGAFNEIIEPELNTFISFNYDTLVEEALSGLQVPYTYGVPGNVIRPAGMAVAMSKPAIKILKLHGSVNWGLPSGRGQITTAYDTYEQVRQRADNHAPVIVPPTWQKSADGPTARVWQESVNALRSATRIIVIGSSLPSTDSYVRYLLAAGLQGNVSLRQFYFVNPEADSEHLKSRYRELLRGELFDNGIADTIPNDIISTVSSYGFMESIGRKVTGHRYAGIYELRIY